MNAAPERGGVGTRAVPACPLCGEPGAPLYAGLRDRMFAAPGAWDLRACAACELAWLDPVPLDEEIPRLYAEYFTHAPPADDRRRGVRDRVRDAILARAYGYRLGAPPFLGAVAMRSKALAEIAGGSVAWLHATPGGRLLELGCGNGTFLRRLRDLGWSVAGVEPDAAAAGIAISQHGLEIHTGEVATAAFPPASFDVVVASHVIEHLSEPVATLRHCRALLRPGGRLIAVTPNLASRGHQRFGPAWVHLDPPRHLRLFGPRALAATAQAAGLRVDCCRSTARDARWAHAASTQIARDGNFPQAVLRIGRLDKLRAVAFQWAEQRCREGGEELLLEASRPS